MELFEIVFKIVHILLFTAGISFNGLLIWLSIFRTPKAILTYSVLILNHAVTDFIGCFSDFYTQARLIPTDWTIAYAVNGFCQYISSWSCAVGFAFQLHCFSHSLYLLSICFTYRYLIIIRKVPSTKILLCIIFTAWIPSLVQTICFITENANSEIIAGIVKKRHPYYNLDGLLFNGYISLFDPFTAYAVFHVTLSPTPIYISILILRRKIISILNLSTSHMREQTKEMHRQLLKALTIQAILPMLNLAAVTIFFTGQFDLYHHPILEYNNLVVVQIVPATTPLISLFYIRPYREAITKFVEQYVLRKKNVIYRKKSSINPETTFNRSERLMSISTSVI